MAANVTDSRLGNFPVQPNTSSGATSIRVGARQTHGVAVVRPIALGSPLPQERTGIGGRWHRRWSRFPDSRGSKNSALPSATSGPLPDRPRRRRTVPARVRRRRSEAGLRGRRTDPASQAQRGQKRSSCGAISTLSDVLPTLYYRDAASRLKNSRERGTFKERRSASFGKRSKNFLFSKAVLLCARVLDEHDRPVVAGAPLGSGAPEYLQNCGLVPGVDGIG